MADDVHARRLTAQLLAGRSARSAVDVAERLLAVQAQDPRAARLAIRARSRRLTAAAVDHALTAERSLVVTWLNRGTLHLVRSEDLAWLHALTTPPLHTGNLRRLAQEGVDGRAAERGVAVVERALARDGPLTRGELRARLDAADVPTAGQALAHVLMRSALLGVVVRGPVANGDHAYALTRDWLGPQGPVDRDAALAELARRYLAAHGPAEDRDLARWAGVPLRDARAGLAAIAGELADHGGGLVDLARARRSPRAPAPVLLGAFEPLLLGWRDRGAVLGDHAARVVDHGVFRAFALVAGRATATWRLLGRDVRIEPLEAMEAADLEALEADARDVRRFLGLRGGAATLGP